MYSEETISHAEEKLILESTIQKQTPDYDGAWKDILEAYLQEFMILCWPEKYQEIDWAKGYKMIEKEFTGFIPKNSKQHLDKLVELYLKNGKSTLILLHLEIERSNKNIFLKRIFDYRLLLEFYFPNQTIATLAILIDDSKSWRPTKFRQEFWNSYVEVGFPYIKILDFQSRIEKLEASDNPFASILLAQLAVSQKKNNKNKLVDKINIIKRLYEKNFSKDDIIKIFYFLERTMVLPHEFELHYTKEVNRIEKERKMRYISSVERKGYQQGECAILLDLVQHKFTTISDSYRQQIEQADPVTLRKWGIRLLDCQSLEEVFK